MGSIDRRFRFVAEELVAFEIGDPFDTFRLKRVEGGPQCRSTGSGSFRSCLVDPGVAVGSILDQKYRSTLLFQASQPLEPLN